MTKQKNDDNEIVVLIFRAWITDKKTGERIYAKQFGKKAFPIWIKGKKPEKSTPERS